MELTENGNFCLFAILYMILPFYKKKSNGKKKTEDQAISLNSFSICSSFKRKFVVCQSGDKETNRCYPFANGLNGLNRVNGLNGLAYLRMFCSCTCNFD